MRRVTVTFAAIKNAFYRLRSMETSTFIIGILTIIVVFPLFIKSGYIFLLDWLVVPEIPFPWNFTSDILFRLGWWFLDLIVPGAVLQKLFLTLMVFSLGLSMHAFLVKHVFRNTESWGTYVGTVLYMFNPFVYSRLLVGQWPIVAAMAILPWFFSSLVLFIEHLKIRHGISAAIWWTIVMAINPHLGFALVIPLTLSAAIVLMGIRRWGQLILWFKGYLAICCVFIILNIYWIIPYVRPGSSFRYFVDNAVTTSDIFAFSTRSDLDHGVLWNTAAMYGFWGDDEMRYVPQKLFVREWFYVFFTLFSVMISGLIISLYPRFRKKNRPFFVNRQTALLLFFTAIVSFILAVGVSFTPWRPMILWMYRTVPFFQSFREPHKFVSLLVFVYAVFLSIGVQDCVERINDIKKSKIQFLKLVVPGILLVLPLVYSPGMLWGFHGQIHPSPYPESWFNIDRYLSDDPDDFRVLFLPWHQYIGLSFARTVIINPAESFFHKTVLAGDNMEFGPIYSHSVRVESRYIEQVILAHKDKLHNTGEKLLPLNVKYVLLTTDSDFFNYAFLDKQKDFRFLFQDGTLKVYLNIAWPRRIRIMDSMK